jgi:probable HAF family extracellular repeat protein
MSFGFFSRLEAASFKALGGGKAQAISADGSTVVGESGYDAWRWTQSGGRQNLGFLPGGDWSDASGVSADGSVVVGTSDSTLGTQGEAFRWTEAGGMVGLGDMTGGAFVSQGLGVSDDGSIVVGMGWSSSGYEAFRWTEAGGMVGLGDLSGGSFYSWAHGISADGSTIVGESESTLGTEAFRWTQSSSMVGLGLMAGGEHGSSAYDASADGSVIVGFGHFGGHFEAFRWTESGGMQSLGEGVAYAVSADGSVEAGYDNGAFIWDQYNGKRDIKEVLENDYGLDLTGWTLTMATGISADGSTIVGYGNNGAWIATITKPGYFTGDLTGDREVNFEDFAKLARYLSQDEFSVDIMPPPSGDGIVDYQDLSIVVEHWLETIEQPEFYEDFESGNFTKYDWEHPGAIDWTVVSDVVYEGSYSAKSGYISDYGASTLQITIDGDYNRISFYRKVSSNEWMDYLKFFIDGVEQNAWSGEQDWTLITYTIAPGEHSFKWYYMNISGISGFPKGGSDCGWIDNVRLYSVE